MLTNSIGLSTIFVMKRAFALLVTLSLLCSSLSLPAFAAVKAGAKCTTKGQIKTSQGKKYTCVKSGKKLIWNTGSSFATVDNSKIENGRIPEVSSPVTESPEIPVEVTKTRFGFNGPCDFDSNAPKEWLPIQKYFQESNKCLGPVRIVPVSLTSDRPRTQNSPDSTFQNVDVCKITAPDNLNVLRAWPSSYQLTQRQIATRIHPSPKTIIQVIPFFTSDSAQPANSPSVDYKMYFDFLKDTIDYISDNGSEFQIRVPDQYFKLPKSLAEYNVTHEWGGPDQGLKRQAFANDLVKVADPTVDFKSVNLVISVAPPGTSLDLSVVATIWDSKADGQNLIVHNASPYTLTKPMRNHAPSISPMWWWHELFHSGIGLADHNGNNYWQNGFGSDPTKPGMGNWGLMSMALTDLLGLEKWVLGHISDKQVRCVNQNSVTTQWLAPSGVKTTEVKLMVIPLGKNEAIIVESQRAAGVNFMLGKESEGALVYHLNSAEPEYEYGLEVLTTNNFKIEKMPFVLSKAPIKMGQSIAFKGVRISVVESGEFGDVVKVEKD